MYLGLKFAASFLPTGQEPGRKAGIRIIAPTRPRYNSSTDLWSLRKDEVLMDMIEVRSVNAAMGHEADIAIVDFTSAENAGFITNKELVCVATTRARYGSIFIFNPAADRGEHLKLLMHDAKRRLHVEGFNWGKYVNSACFL